MGIKKFIRSVRESLDLDEAKKSSKKKSIKNLLKKLNNKKRSIKKAIKDSSQIKEKKEWQEELEIISLQIKKGKGILFKLYSKKKEKGK